VAGRSAAQRGEGGGVVRLLGDLRHHLGVGHLAVGIDDDDGAGGDAGSMPSAAQKRPMANGRSAATTRMVAPSTWLASSLNLRVEVAQVGVSRLGTMFSRMRLPA